MGQALSLLPKVKPPTWRLKDEGGLNSPSWWCTFFCLSDSVGCASPGSKLQSTWIYLIGTSIHTPHCPALCWLLVRAHNLVWVIIAASPGLSLAPCKVSSWKGCRGDSSSPRFPAHSLGFWNWGSAKLWPGNVYLSIARSGKRWRAGMMSKAWWLLEF